MRAAELEAFLVALHALVSHFPARFDGLESHEVLADLDDPCRVQYISRWQDEEALIRFAGPDWRTSPVTFPGETRMLLRPLTVRHFISARPTDRS